MSSIRNGFIKAVLIILGVLIAAGSLVYGGYRFWEFRNEKLALDEKLKIFEESLRTARDKVYSLESDKAELSELLESERSKNSLFESQIQGIAGTVGTLKKLTETDPELLKKYSKVYFLNENYKPLGLVVIDPQYILDTGTSQLFYGKTWQFLQSLLFDAVSQGVDIKILSAYRSFEIQSNLKSAYTVTYGSGANQFSADQGYSEHQLGTAVDFTTLEDGSALSLFKNSDTYKWLLGNAYKYGFVLSYPENNSYYIFEPWHWRFVGRVLAQKLHDDSKYFYDLDQRGIDQYLISFFD